MHSLLTGSEPVCLECTLPPNIPSSLSPATFHQNVPVIEFVRNLFKTDKKVLLCFEWFFNLVKARTFLF